MELHQADVELLQAPQLVVENQADVELHQRKRGSVLPAAGLTIRPDPIALYEVNPFESSSRPTSDRF